MLLFAPQNVSFYLAQIFGADWRTEKVFQYTEADFEAHAPNYYREPAPVLPRSQRPWPMDQWTLNSNG